MAPSQEASRASDRKTAPVEHPALARIAAAARRILGIGETRVIGGVSRTARPAVRLPIDQPLPLSSFQMLGLDEVRSKLGDRWPAMRDKVHLIARNTIARHLIRGDVFEPHGEDSYLVLFASLGAAEAEFKSRVIAREISEHLLGEGQAIKVSACVTELTHEQLSAPDQGCALTEALAKMEEARDETFESVAAIIREELGEGDGAEARSSKGPLAAPRALDAPPACAYTPVWDTTQMTLLRYRTGASDRVGEDDTFEADLALVRAAGEELRLLGDGGLRRPLTLVIRQPSLGGNAQRAALRQAIAGIAAPLRRLITLEISLKRDEWSYGSRSFLEAARPTGCGFSVLMDIDSPHPLPQEPGLREAGVTLASLAEDASETECMRLLAAFARTKAQGFTPSAHGLGTRSLVLGAVASGFRYLSGLAIHPDYENLTHAVRFQAADLYRDLAEGFRAPKQP